MPDIEQKVAALEVRLDAIEAHLHATRPVETFGELLRILYFAFTSKCKQLLGRTD